MPANGILRAGILLALASALFPTSLNGAKNPIATPAGEVRYYFHALDTHQCALASKFGEAGSTSLSAFMRGCRSIRHAAVQQLVDPGYRLHPQTAAYTCLAVRYIIVRKSPETFGGWYLMERTLGPAWHIVFARSHIAPGGRAIRLTRSQCAGHLPAYVHPGSGTIVSGFAFRSATSGWIALSNSGSYMPNGSCGHGIGTNCDSASTTIYRTGDAGRHWTRLLHFRTAVGPPVWIRRFGSRVGLVAATVGPLNAKSNERFSSTLFRTHDGGRHWQRWLLPTNYATIRGTISFPDPRHGWVWCCGDGAMGSMAVYVYRTVDGGQRWRRVACTAFPNPTPGYGCPHPSGISLGGDKGDLVFKDVRTGWLTADENTGVPDLYQTANGGALWRRQAIQLPRDVAHPSGKAGSNPIYSFGTLLPPASAGRIALIPEDISFYRPKPQVTRSRLYVFRSPGGSHWEAALRTPITGTVSFWQALDARHWVFAATATSGQTIWWTPDGGVSWKKRTLHLPAGLTLVGPQFTDEREGWATAQTRAESTETAPEAVLLHTTDGGAHWDTVALP